VTNLPKSRLSDRQVATIYAARWGVEVFFRTFKQTFGCRKLRSRSAAHAQLELEWALVGLWSVCLLGTRELGAYGSAPTRLSPAAALRAFQADPAGVSPTTRNPGGNFVGPAAPRPTR
jgi:IS4 transposase